MVEDASKNGPSVTAGDDPRITKIGKFLRRTKIDELPQLWNVLKGDMSFVGPRPLVEKQVLCFQKDYKEIFKIRPGITDYATISFRNEEEILRKCNSNDVERIYIEQILPQKIELCKKYLKEMGFLTDIKIILKTLLAIIRY
jgi:lipopolysaccharide/colanic/teichoic acid biosynthesis glycosyltransferase